VLYVGPSGQTPAESGTLTSNGQVKTPLSQGSLSLGTGYGNPEGLGSREPKPCRDFPEEDCVVLPIESRCGAFELKIDRGDLTLISGRLKVARQRTTGGYVRFVPTTEGGPVYIRIVEKALGRPLKKGEVVHHINGDPFDCRRRNLLVMKNSEHLRLHWCMGTLYAWEHFRSSSGGDRLVSLVKETLGRNTRSIRGIYQVI